MVLSALCIRDYLALKNVIQFTPLVLHGIGVIAREGKGSSGSGGAGVVSGRASGGDNVVGEGSSGSVEGCGGVVDWYAGIGSSGSGSVGRSE